MKAAGRDARAWLSSGTEIGMWVFDLKAYRLVKSCTSQIGNPSQGHDGLLWSQPSPLPASVIMSLHCESAISEGRWETVQEFL